MMFLNHVRVESLVIVEGVSHSLFLTDRTAMNGGSLQKLLSARTIVHAIMRIIAGFQLSLIKRKECRTLW
eukprot:3077882-Heterocapsa_arctica.AAC.1